MPSPPSVRHPFRSRAPSLLAALLAAATVSAEPGWRTLETADGSHARARHEAGAVVVGGELYLLGGRGRPPLERFSPSASGWTDLGAAPLELHHFQPVTIDGRIYVVGAFTCCYPREETVAEIHVYDTREGTWDIVGEMPPERVRGSTAAVVRDGRIYLLGGNTRGHDGGAVAWFDEYDPATGAWTVLADAPHARDHFTAALVGDTLVAAAGRRSTMPNPAANPVLATDVYDFASGEWRSAAPIPTARAGTVTVAHGGEAIVAGGEINTSNDAVDAVEAFDPGSGAWRALPSLGTGRHGAGAGVIDDALHVVAGASSIGGATETHLHETLALGPSTSPPGSTDPSSPDEPSGSGGSEGPSTPVEPAEPDGEPVASEPEEPPVPDGGTAPPEPDGSSGADGSPGSDGTPTTDAPAEPSDADATAGDRRGGGGLGGGPIGLLAALLGVLASRGVRSRRP